MEGRKRNREGDEGFNELQGQIGTALLGLDNVFYVLNPSNGGLTTLDDVDKGLFHAAIEPPSTPSEGALSDGRATPPGRTLSNGRALSEAGRTLSVYPRA